MTVDVCWDYRAGKWHEICGQAQGEATMSNLAEGWGTYDPKDHDRSAEPDYQAAGASGLSERSAAVPRTGKRLLCCALLGRSPRWCSPASSVWPRARSHGSSTNPTYCSLSPGTSRGWVATWLWSRADSLDQWSHGAAGGGVAVLPDRGVGGHWFDLGHPRDLGHPGTMERNHRKRDRPAGRPGTSTSTDPPGSTA
jgi:hypothetical protein